MLYTLNVAMAFAFLSSLYGDFMKAVGSSVRIFELIDRVPEVKNEGGAQLLDFSGEIEFDNVDFTYPSRPDNPVLKVNNEVIRICKKKDNKAVEKCDTIKINESQDNIFNVEVFHKARFPFLSISKCYILLQTHYNLVSGYIVQAKSELYRYH